MEGSGGFEVGGDWIADGYQVQDQPWLWLTLVNSSGKITWQHDGWVSLPALEKATVTHSR